MRPTMNVEIWSDVICPWCYIGKRRLESAAAMLRDEVELNVTFRPFQLDPGAQVGETVPVFDAYARKFGGEERATQIIEHITSVARAEGLEFRLDRALRANTLLAHRLLWLAEPTGHQYALKERLLQAYFCEGLNIGDADVLAACAQEVGMPYDAVAGFLAGDDGTDEVRAQLEFAAEADITAVPTFLFDGRWLVPGAQDPDTFATVVRRLLEKSATRAETTDV